MFHGTPAARPADGGDGASAQATGFPSPARDYYHGGIDLNRHLIRDRTSTFIMRVAGNSMAAAGIADGDEIIVDRSLVPRDGNVVVAVLDGELVIRRLRLTGRGVVLQADSAGQPDAEVPELADLTVWGVVTRCLHHV
ncbi:translesion error-prone DNA polymerase V autoproteolytic subunit [Arthrobacter sp. I2-34]|uniref:Translesion error-prone DNA polymerase V autoproteolytic subunit n=1 Tax=Arthrobacter hankyongi TaxID=2904801 RepID=A0ABS9LBI1_9MICC|nr:translesion error-prone DNA polymerase V autoproteolytic subunit [Arthrobacter hankyongi]MCG2623961.1 translesion error-prone DNA polymerase V autoproteolytic subunit [Arthrobacter hankyongi]